MKKLCILVILIALMISGCLRLPDTYPYAGIPEEIVSIELMYNRNRFGEGIDMDHISLIRALEADEIIPFMQDIYAVETIRVSPPFWGWGRYIARVTYRNGDVEMLGSINIEYIPNGETGIGEGRYIFQYDNFVAVFGMYADLTLYPDP